MSCAEKYDINWSSELMFLPEDADLYRQIKMA